MKGISILLTDGQKDGQKQSLNPASAYARGVIIYCDILVQCGTMSTDRKLPLANKIVRASIDFRSSGETTEQGQGLGLGLGTSLFPVGATEIKDFLPDL